MANEKMNSQVVARRSFLNQVVQNELPAQRHDRSGQLYWSGIRTRETLTGLPPFQGGGFSHSPTQPNAWRPSVDSGSTEGIQGRLGLHKSRLLRRIFSVTDSGGKRREERRLNHGRRHSIPDESGLALVRAKDVTSRAAHDVTVHGFHQLCLIALR